MLGRKLQSPEEPAPPLQPPTRCTESFDGLRPRVGGADLGWVPAALRPWVAQPDQDLRPHGGILTAWLTLLRAGRMMNCSRDLFLSVWQPSLETVDSWASINKGDIKTQGKACCHQVSSPKPCFAQTLTQGQPHFRIPLALESRACYPCT